MIPYVISRIIPRRLDDSSTKQVVQFNVSSTIVGPNICGAMGIWDFVSIVNDNI